MDCVEGRTQTRVPSYTSWFHFACGKLEQHNPYVPLVVVIVIYSGDVRNKWINLRHTDYDYVSYKANIQYMLTSTSLIHISTNPR